MRIKLIIKKIIKAVIPHGIYILYKRYKEPETNRKLFYGNESPNYCPICEKASYFGYTGFTARKKARCIYCGSLERNRLLWLFLKKKTDFFERTRNKMLHIAAEPCFMKSFKRIFGRNYLTADLYNPTAMIKMNIMNIKYPENSFDIIICSHVLEHVENDRKAMQEFYRVLKQNGFAILLVPIADMENTYEDFSINTESGRFIAFGQNDHVRKYGKDFINRLEMSGFKVRIIKAKDFLSDEEIDKYHVKEELVGGGDWMFMNTEIYYCTK